MSMTANKNIRNAGNSEWHTGGRMDARNKEITRMNEGQ